MNVLFVGQAPGKSWDGRARALIGYAGKLGGMMNMGPDEFLQLFDTANVLRAFPGKNGKGDAFPMREAREMAAAMDFLGWDALVILGKATAKAFGIHAPRYFDCHTVRGKPAFIFPHPSGVNRWWNSPENADVAGAFLRCLLHLAFPDHS